MKQSHRNILGAVSTVFLIGLFATAAPVRAASTDERIKALESELNQLKAEQQKVQREQSLMKEDALAARAKLPSFRYRPGRGLRIRGADRSWEITLGAKWNAHLSFFPAGGRSLTDADETGPSQGSMVWRHMEFDHYYRLLNGLYHFGVTWNAADGRSKSEIFQIRFSKWSPYYPDFRILALSPRTYSPQTRVSSGSGMAMERAPVYDNQFATGSTKGLALQWSDIPVGPMKIDTATINYLSGNIAWDSKKARDPVDQKGVILGMSVDPFAKSKNKYLKGLQTGMTYLNARTDVNHGGDSRIRVRTRGRNNRVEIFRVNTRGRHKYYEPWINWTSGPFELGYVFSRSVGGRDFTGKAGGSDFSDTRLTTNTLAAGVYFWGPKGFMSGSRNRGWRLSFTHNRSYFDAGSGFDTESKFTSMRRWHYLENILLLRWYQARNLTYAIEYQINSVSKMKGGGSAADARRRLGILSTGGTYQMITLHTLWEF